MTIDELLAAAGLTANDEIPIWDAEATGEPTKKITAQNLMNGLKVLGDLVNTEEMDSAIAQVAATPYVATIPTGQWSGSGSDYYITVTAANVTANSILIPQYDKASASLLRGAVWCVPGTGSFTIHTSAIPAGTVSIMVMFAGTMGEAQYQVLADVYSKSQTDALIAQSTAKFIVGNATTSARMAANPAIENAYATIRFIEDTSKWTEIIFSTDGIGLRRTSDGGSNYAWIWNGH